MSAYGAKRTLRKGFARTSVLGTPPPSANHPPSPCVFRNLRKKTLPDSGTNLGARASSTGIQNQPSATTSTQLGAKTGLYKQFEKRGSRVLYQKIVSSKAASDRLSHFEAVKQQGSNDSTVVREAKQMAFRAKNSSTDISAKTMDKIELRHS